MVREAVWGYVCLGIQQVMARHIICLVDHQDAMDRFASLGFLNCTVCTIDAPIKNLSPVHHVHEFINQKAYF